MKSSLFLSALAMSLGLASIGVAQVAVESTPVPTIPPGTAVTPAPATPVAPTPGGERRAIRREERRIDRNDPTGTMAPAVQPNGTVTATPNTTAPSARTSYYRAPNSNYYARPYRRGLLGRRYYY